MRSTIDLTGKVFGRLTVLDKAIEGGHTLWRCQCSCADKSLRLVTTNHLVTGHTQSCGCLFREALKRPNSGQFQPKYPTKLGYDASRILIDMKRRCYKENNRYYSNYGGRGITICDEWLNDSRAFVDWMLEHGWTHGLSIDRIDNNGPYSPENCRIATCQIQANNCRSNRVLTYDGVSQSIAEWQRDINDTDKQLRRICGKNNNEAGVAFIASHLEPLEELSDTEEIAYEEGRLG